MNMAHDENIVVPFEEGLAGDIREMVGDFGLSAAIPPLAVVRHAYGKDVHPVRVEQEASDFDDKRVANNGPDEAVVLVVRNEEVAVGAVDVPALRSDENPVAVKSDSEVVVEKILEPAIVVAAEQVDIDATPSGLVDRVEEVEVAFGDHTPVFKKEIENVPEKKHRGVVRDLLEKRPETRTPLRLGRVPGIEEMGVREEVDSRGLQFQVL